ncbi:MAG: WG repeat-containing protein [Sporocytophaga sp.]|uniref:WG repeat-containing protein n=1 Tax=Sporocytophaga sp. TaxID=2231183 RepID=UPI001B06C1D0|nr:WG repeat-containing protein [Sporocytophaga sp.]MBO9700347.1 WG repeat-containing protein [Sporocytophaga sp.]
MRKILFIFIIIFLKEQVITACPLLPVKSNGKWGFVDCNGELKINFDYDRVSNFSEGYSIVRKNEKYGVIDREGNVVIPFGYKSVQALKSGFFILEDSAFALANVNGKVLTPFVYSGILQINKYSFLLQDKEKGYRLFHSGLLKISNDLWSNASEFDSSGYFQVWTIDGQAGVTDSLHNVIISPKLGGEFIKTGNYFAFKKYELYSFYNTLNEIVSGDREWRYFKVIDKDFVIVYNKPSELTLLNLRNKKYLLEKRYSNFSILMSEYIIIKNLNGVGVADTAGSVLHEPVFDAIALLDKAHLIVKKGKHVGLLNHKGNVILPVKYDFIDPFNSFGMSVFSLENKLGLLKTNGKVFQLPQYDDMEVEDNRLKCYRGTDLDIFSFTQNNNLEEKLTYHNVHRIVVGGRVYKPWNGNFFNTVNFDTNSISLNSRNVPFTVTKGERYTLVLKRHTYAVNAKIKTLIKNNLHDVTHLIGIKETDSAKYIANTEYWDIQLEEMEKYGLTRVILPGSRHGLLKSNGHLTTQLNLKVGGRMVNQLITYIGPFQNGVARVNIGGSYVNGNDINDDRRTMFGHSLKIVGGRWGYLNTKGKMFIDPKFEYASDFINGKAIISIDKKYGVIDSLGKYVIEPKYGFIGWLPESKHRFFQLQEIKKLEGLIDGNGKVLLKTEYENVGEVNENLIPVKKDGLWGFCSLDGNLVIESAYAEVNGFNEGLSAVKSNGLWGYINSGGQYVIAPAYSSAGNFSEGIAPVKDRSGWKYIDHNGQIVIRGKFSRAESFKDGIALVKQNRKWGTINRDGKILIKPRYKNITMSENLVLAQKKNGKSVIYAYSGKKLNKDAFKQLGSPSEGQMSFVKGNKNGFLDTTGNVAFYTNHVTNRTGFHEGLAFVRIKGGGSGFITFGDSLQIQGKFQSCGPFSEGLAVCLVRGHTTVIDHFGNVVFAPAKETQIGQFSNNYLVVGNKFYNKSGEMVLKANKAESFKNNRAIIGLEEKVAGTDQRMFRNELLDINLTPIASYTTIVPQESGYYTISTESNNGLAESNGNILLPCKFQNIKYVGNNIFRIENYGNFGYIRQDGSWIWKPEL